MTEENENLGAGVGFIDGEYQPISEVKIPVSDLGFLMSDVIHDAVHVWKGSIFRLDDHLDRFERSVAGVRMILPCDRAEIVQIMMECVRLSGLRDSLVYLIASRGIPTDSQRDLRTCTNRFMVLAYPFLWYLPPEQMDTGAHVIISSIIRIPPESIDPKIKNFNRLDFSRALFEAYDRGGEYPILLDFEGNVTEGRGFNVFALFGGKLVSPKRGVLEGMTRRTVMELCAETNVKAVLGNIKPADLRNADEAFLTSTAGGIMPVTKVDDQLIGNGSTGPLTLRLKDRYWALHENPKYVTPVAYV
jgi:branched-chain amino acid aminotransferase